MGSGEDEKSFETVPEARNRAILNEKNIKKGVKRVKDHVGPFSSYQIDVGILNVAASWTDEDLINFTDIGKEFIKKDGQIPPRMLAILFSLHTS